MRRDEAYLLDIVQAGHQIADFTDSMDSKSLSADLKTLFAVCHQLAVIGEAANKLSTEFRESQNEIPWKQIIGMRNHLIHAYHNVDSEIVWNAATKSVPALLNALEPHVPKKP